MRPSVHPQGHDNMQYESNGSRPGADSRGTREYLGISLRGLAMGAADVVPGVSGGTIAIISGIYEELIHSIKSIDLDAAKRLFNEGFGSFWQSINGNFLLALVVGIGVSIFSLAKLLHHALETQPILIWSFFFGLVVASSLFVARRVSAWTAGRLAALVLGAAGSYLITLITPAEPNTAYWFVLVSGAIAICAMILPGISGSFILVLLGMYKYVISAISELQMAVLLTFAAGAAAGLMGFSRLLSWLLRRYHDLTIAALVGIMIGSLNKVWPWKLVTEWQLDRHGDRFPASEHNLLPQSYGDFPAGDLIGATNDPQLLLAVLLAACGFLTIAAFEMLTRPKAREA